MCRVDDDAIRMSRRITMGEPEVLAPGRVAKVTTAIAADEAAVQPAVATVAARCAAIGQAPDGGHSNSGDHYRPLSGPGFQVIADVPAAARLARGPVNPDPGTQ